MKRIKKHLATLLVFIFLINSFENTVLAIKNEACPAIETVDSNGNESITEECLVKWTLGGSWETGHNMTVTIFNKGNKAVNNWSLSFEYSHQITQIWNAEVVSFTNNRITVKNVGWNKDIPAGGEITFGFACAEPFTNYPQNYKVHCGQLVHVNGKVEVTVENSWCGGCKGFLTLSNLSDKPIEDWQVEFKCNGHLETIWDGQIISKTGVQYVVKNAGYNYVIEPYACKTIGFVLSCEDCENAFSDFYLSSANCIEEYATETSTEASAETNAEASTEASAEINTEASTEASTEINTEASTEASTEAGAEINTEASTEANTEASTEASEEINTEASTETNAETSVESNSETNEGDNEQDDLSADYTQGHVDDVLGEIYSKRFALSDVVIDDEKGIGYIKNQMLLSAHLGVDKSTIESIAEELNARIVGFIELTNDYQLEFIDDKTIEEIYALIDMVCDTSYVSSCSLNYFIENETDSEMPWEDELFTDEIKAWNKGGITEYNKNTEIRNEGALSCKTGDNWGLKALNIPAAWQITNHENSVKTGIYDWGFALEHEDLSFGKQYNNINISDDRSHGTHIAGIIAAKHNKIGIAGVATNAELVTYTYDGKGFDLMKEKLALATLIGNHVRVINYSQTSGYELAYAASNTNAIKHITAIRNVELLKSNTEEFLLKLCAMGYDFNIVTSAGNTNGIRFVDDSSKIYGYRWVQRGDQSGKIETDVMAEYNSALNAITDPLLKQKIIVVGAVSHTAKENNTIAEFYMDKASNLGDRVDVVAPGFEILSTVPESYQDTKIKGYALQSGTSMAAPYVTGIIALMYQSNPSLSAEEAKRIICDRDNYTNIVEYKGVEYYMPDAEKCVRAALEMEEGEQPTNPKENGIVTGRIQLHDGKESGIVKVLLTENYLISPRDKDTYEFSSTTDGTVVCSVPEGIYKLVIQKDGYATLTVWDVEVKSEETNDLGVMELTRLPRLMQLKGWIYHLQKGIPGATIRIRQGLRNKTGEYLKDENGVVIEASSDENGYYDIEILEGEYTFEILKDGYASEYVSVRMESDETGKQTIERDIDVMYKYDEVYRMVLDWRYSSVDLDIAASVISYGRNAARVQPKKNDNWLVYPDIRIIKDVKDGSESEIMLIANADKILNGDNIYLAISVADDGCRQGTFLGLHYSTQAKISLYKGEKLLQVFEVPRDIDRKVWYAFNIKEDDKIEVVNRNTDLIP